MLNKRHYAYDALVLVSGALLPLAFAPLNLVPLALLVPAVLFYAIYDMPKWLAIRRGYLFGMGLFAVGASWVYVAISDFGFTSWPVAFLLTFIFVAFLALFHAFQAYVCYRLTFGLSFSVACVVFGFSWLLFEWIRGWFMTGFPWLNLGYAHTNTPLAGYAPILGVYGVSLMSLVVTVSLCLTLNVKRYFIGIAVAIIATVFVGGWALQKITWSEKSGEPLKVAIVQASLSQVTKWDPDQIRYRMDVYTEMTEPLWGKYDLIMWPENTLTILWQDAPTGFRDALQQRSLSSGTTLVLGVPYGSVETKYYSSLVVIGKTPGLYHKRHLVPFGEYVPLPDFARKLAGFFDLPMSGFSAGEKSQSVLDVAGQKMAPTICYEDAFGEELIDFLPAATVLINGSNNAWYGRSWAAPQHLQIARMRAIETQRQSIRSTTTGISALINERGELIGQTQLLKKEILTGSVQPLSGATPYVSWGNWPVLIIVFLSLLIFIGRELRQR